MTAMATMPGALPAGERGADAAQAARRQYTRWTRRLQHARDRRRQEEIHVWKPLYEQFVGPMVRHKPNAAADVVNALAEYAETMLPHLLGDDRECTVRVNRLAAGEDRGAKLALADTLGDQATALARAVGLYEDAAGRPGELALAVTASLYSMGVMLLGFEPPRGMTVGRDEAHGESAETKTIDLDWELSGRRERADAGLPFARWYPATRFLGDAQYNDFLRGDWCAFEDYVPLHVVRKLWARYHWKQTHSAEPTWCEAESDQSGDQSGDGGLVRITHVYLRRPAMVLLMPDEQAGVQEVIEAREIDLGLEGLPVRLLGTHWMPHSPYPKPAFARGAAAAREENELALTGFAAASKIKAMVLVDEEADPGLAQRVRRGDDNGVYEIKAKGGKRIDELVVTREVGALRPEFLRMQEKARQISDRSFGASDLTRGVREPGNPTATEAAARMEHIATRLAWMVAPTRRFEASICQGLIATAYAKLDHLHGMALALGEGVETRFVGFDATAPMIGELLDFSFAMAVADRVTDADSVNQINNVLAQAPGLKPMLAEEGKGLRASPLVEEWLRRSRVPRRGEVLIDLPPPQAPPMAAENTMPEDDAATQPAPAAPAVPAVPGAVDPAAELQALAAQLAQIPEGDPAEDEILARMAELQAAGETQSAAA